MVLNSSWTQEHDFTLETVNLCVKARRKKITVKHQKI